MPSSISVFQLLPCFCSSPLPSPQFRVSGLIPVQECNYVSSYPGPGGYKQLTWHFGFSLWRCVSGRSAPSSIPCWVGLGARPPSLMCQFLSQALKSETLGSPSLREVEQGAFRRPDGGEGGWKGWEMQMRWVGPLGKAGSLLGTQAPGWLQ